MQELHTVLREGEIVQAHLYIHTYYKQYVDFIEIFLAM